MEVYANWSVGVSLSNIFQKYGYETDYKLYNPYKEYSEGDYSLGLNYTFMTGSRHSQNLIFDQDEEGQGMNFMDPLTRGDLILAVVRWYDSYDEPAEYVAPTDENGVTWNAELIYETYIKPIQDIAIANNVGFIIGEVGLCNSPRANLISQEDALEYGKEMVAMFKNHGIAYSHFNYMSDMGFARLYNPNLPSREGEVMTPVTYTFDDYEYSFYVDQELMDVWAGKE